MRNSATCDALCDLVPFEQFNVKNTHGGMLILVKLQAKIPLSKCSSATTPHLFNSGTSN